MRLRNIRELGFHNRYTAGRCLVCVADSLQVGRGPLPPPLLRLLRESLAESGVELAAFPGQAEADAAAIAGGLAAALQSELYRKPWRSGALPADPGSIRFFLEYVEPDLARFCVGSALGLTAKLLEAGSEPGPALAASLRELLKSHRQRQYRATLQINTRELLEKAEARGIPWKRIVRGAPHTQLGQGRKLQRFRHAMCGLDSVMGSDLSRNKILAHRILAGAALPVPKTAQLFSEDQAAAMARAIGYPVVIKPNSLLKGAGVFVNLATEDEVRQAYTKAAAYGAGVNMESMIAGDDHRILVVAGRFVAVARREPAKVTGDGKLCLRELVAAENDNPLRRNRHLDMLELIKLDEETDRLLARIGLTLDTVPAQGRIVPLKATANIATGGTATDFTDSIHPDNIAMAERAARLVDIEVAGIDYITTDISRSFRETGGAICEVNTWVSLAPHRIADPTRDIISPILERAFPPGDDGRIPIAAITGSERHGAVVHRLARILKAAGLPCGDTTDKEARIDGVTVDFGKLAGYSGAELVLHDPLCAAAALALDPADIVRRGLAFDRCNVAGVFGVTELSGEARAAVRRLCASATDAVVLRAEDADPRRRTEFAEGRRLILVAEHGLDETLRRHLADGGEAVLAETGKDGEVILMYRKGTAHEVLLPGRQIVRSAAPADREELASALAAAALALGLDLPPAIIAAGLAG